MSCIACYYPFPPLIADLCNLLDALSPTTGSNPSGGRFLGFPLVGVLLGFRQGNLFAMMLFDLLALDFLERLLDGEPRLLEPESVDITMASLGNI